MSDKTKRYPWNKGKSDDDAGMTEVYAGPPFEPDQVEGVYAGPPIQEPMMCVYAGPEFFNGGAVRPAGAWVKYCAACGGVIRDEYKFCPSCGAPIPREEK